VSGFAEQNPTTPWKALADFRLFFDTWPADDESLDLRYEFKHTHFPYNYMP